MNFKIVSDYEKESLRRKFIESFIDTKTEHYKKYIATLKEYPDGMCYDGYLWDSLIENYEIIEKTMEHAIEYLKSKENVLVMWDMYSEYRVYDNRIFSSKYPKDIIIETDSSELCQYIEKEWGDYSTTEDKYLPEDIYVFDRSMSWYVIFTHEGYDSFTKLGLGDDDYIRICFVNNSI